MPLRYYAKRWSTGDRHSYAQLTRFLPDSVLDRFERVRLEPAKADAGTVAPLPSANVRDKIAAMWG
jgi:DNA helicase-2/ATP-dependent DNA helicase PcrA